MPEVERVRGDAKRLKQRAVKVGQPVREPVQECCRPAEELPHSAVQAAVTGELDLRAQVPVAVAALPARLTWDRRIDRYPFAAAGAGRDHPGVLVPEGERPAQVSVADARFGPPVQVGATDPDRGDPDQARARLEYGYGLIGEPDVSCRVQACHLHGTTVT